MVLLVHPVEVGGVPGTRINVLSTVPAVGWGGTSGGFRFVRCLVVVGAIQNNVRASWAAGDVHRGALVV